ncbi:UNVERIFIED_CONTAM: NF-X1-type zinc finger protein NFXL2 [Sesamum angustifolium]|uniref:NF-X1-type zinc finger protein NFXL2 n=1 Tax=Sesamum angustifolium TaxID=2727405 RepID=A0AAW2LEW5_9LAMI
MAVRSCNGPCHRKLPNCTHLCPETCHTGPCPSPDKCSKKHITVQVVIPDVPKNQYGVGLLPCGNDCKSKVKVPDAELHFRQTKPPEEKESDKATNVSKRRRRRQRVPEEENTSTLQVWLYS